MKYLTEHKIVHKDLALRNLLVKRDLNNKFVVKIGDFGMSQQGNERYDNVNSQMIPIKWSAPEV